MRDYFNHWIRIGFLTAVLLVAAVPASATSLGLEPGSGPNLRVRLFATDGFTSELPIFEVGNRPDGGFLDTQVQGLLQPVLLADELGFTWETLSYSGVLGALAQPVALQFSKVRVRWWNDSRSLNEDPLLLGASETIEANTRAGVVSGQLSFGGVQLPFEIDLGGTGFFNGTVTLRAEASQDFDRLRVSADSNNTTVVPFTTPIGSINGIDFSLAVGADLDGTSFFDTAYAPVPEPGAGTLIGIGVLAAVIGGRRIPRTGVRAC